MSQNQEGDVGPSLIPNVKFKDAAEEYETIQVEIDKRNHSITIEDKQELKTQDQYVTRYNLRQYVLPEGTPMEPFKDTIDQEVKRVTLAAEEEYDAAEAAKAKVVEQTPQKEVEPEKVEEQPPQKNEEPEKVEEQPPQKDEEPEKVEEQPPQKDEEPEKVEEQPPQKNEEPEKVEEQPPEKVEEQPPQPFWKEKISIPLFRYK